MKRFVVGLVAVVVLAGVRKTHAETISWQLDIFGGLNDPVFKFTNTSTSAVRITGLNVTIGDTAYSFDTATFESFSPGITFIRNRPDTNNGGGTRSDDVDYSITAGFNPTEFFEYSSDVDLDPIHTDSDYREVLFNNGDASNSVVSVTYSNGSTLSLTLPDEGLKSSYTFVSILELFTHVDIDIKPGSDPNSINCNNQKKIIAVAILTTDDFVATTVDHTTVTFEGASETDVNKKTGVVRRHEEDVDGDCDTDLVLHFRLGDTVLTCDSTVGTLKGQTFGGDAIEGTDSVRMIDAGGG